MAWKSTQRFRPNASRILISTQAQRRRGHGHRIFVKTLDHDVAEVFSYRLERHMCWNRRHRVTQTSQHFKRRWRHDVGTNRQLLAQLYERGPELDERVPRLRRPQPLPRGTLGGRLVGPDEGTVGSYPGGDGCQGRGDL